MYKRQIIVVDGGLAFPEDDMLGIDLVIPDITYLRDNIRKVKGFVITHEMCIRDRHYCMCLQESIPVRIRGR